MFVLFVYFTTFNPYVFVYVVWSRSIGKYWNNNSIAVEKGHLDQVELPEAQEPEESTAEREKRKRTLTEKGKELYKKHCLRFVNDSQVCKDQLSKELMSISIVKSYQK